MHAKDKHSLEIPTGDLILFDGTCIFCSGFARFMVRFDKSARFRFVTAQSEPGRALYKAHNLGPDLMETSITILDGTAYTKFRAFAAAMRGLGWSWRILSLIRYLPRRPSNWLYDVLARNRYRIAGKRACPMPTPELKARLIA